MNTKIFVPKKCKVGFNPRNDTYTGMLGYVIYHDGKIWRKEKSWDGWIYKYKSDEEYEKEKRTAYNYVIDEMLKAEPRKDSNMCQIYVGAPFYRHSFEPVSTREQAESLLDYEKYTPNLGKYSNDPKIKPFEFDNVPMEGFVLNRKAGGNNTGWNHRNTYCRVYDPRGFEFEITIPNLLYILENSNSIKGKGLEGKFIYGWDGTELVLVPEQSPEFIEMISFTELQDMKVSKKELIPGGIYINSNNIKLTYMGEGFEYSSYYRKFSSSKKLWFHKKGYLDHDEFINCNIKSIKKYTGENNENYANLMDKLEESTRYFNGDKNSKYVEIENPYEKLTEQLNNYYHKSYYIKVNNKFLKIKIKKNFYYYDYGCDYDVVIKNENEKFKSIKDILNKYTLWEIKMTK